jgi:hypothetical protein
MDFDSLFFAFSTTLDSAFNGQKRDHSDSGIDYGGPKPKNYGLDVMKISDSVNNY